jgi:DUF971 family protein
MKVPIRVERLGESGVRLEYEGGESYELSSLILRKYCPSAVSKAKRGEGAAHEKPLTTPKSSMLKIVDSSIEEETKLVKIWPIGNYAIGMEWSDGHNTGIYSFEYLYQLTQQKD